jgi:hypothetical protein
MPLPSSPLVTIAGVVNHLRWVEHDFIEVDLDGQPSRAPTDVDGLTTGETRPSPP